MDTYNYHNSLCNQNQTIADHVIKKLLDTQEEGKLFSALPNAEINTTIKKENRKKQQAKKIHRTNASTVVNISQKNHKDTGSDSVQALVDPNTGEALESFLFGLGRKQHTKDFFQSFINNYL